MARGDLGEFFINTTNALQRQQVMADESLLRKAQTSNLLQKMQDDRDEQAALSEVDFSQYDNPYEPFKAIADKVNNPRIKASLLGKYATTREAHFDRLAKNLMMFKEDPEAFNEIVQSSAYKDYRKENGIKDGGVINPKAGEQYYTHIASPDNPLETPKGILTEGTYEVKEKKGQVTQWLRKDKDKESKAPTSPFQSYRAGEIAKGNTDESKIASGWQQQQKALVREGGRNIQYEKNMFMAAKAANVDPKKIANGTASQKEVQDTLTEYNKKFGAQSLIQMLMSGGGTTNTTKFDAQGNAIE